MRSPGVVAWGSLRLDAACTCVSFMPEISCALVLVLCLYCHAVCALHSVLSMGPQNGSRRQYMKKAAPRCRPCHECVNANDFCSRLHVHHTFASPVSLQNNNKPGNPGFTGLVQQPLNDFVLAITVRYNSCFITTQGCQG